MIYTCAVKVRQLQGFSVAGSERWASLKDERKQNRDETFQTTSLYSSVLDVETNQMLVRPIRKQKSIDHSNKAENEVCWIYSVCQKVTSFWYLSFLPLLDAQRDGFCWRLVYEQNWRYFH